MTATTQSLRLFAEEQGYSMTKARELIRQGFIPVLPREDENCMIIVNKKLYDDLNEAGLLVVPRSERSVNKQKEEGNVHEK